MTSRALLESVDWHCHLLPDLDDGPQKLVESIQMLRQLFSAGYRQVHCTPHHIRGLYDTSSGEVRRATQDLGEAAAAAGLDIRLLPGMEYCLDEFLAELLADPVPLGNTDMLLAEVPQASVPKTVHAGVDAILATGLIPVIAHPERCPTFFSPLGTAIGGGLATLQDKFETLANLSTLLTALIEKGCRFQANLGSFMGVYGPEVQRQAELFLDLGLYSLLGTDGHGSRSLGRVLSDPGLRHRVMDQLSTTESLVV